VFNVDGSPNKAGLILEVIDVILQYNIYLEWMLFAVSSLGRQDLILDYSWLKNHNPKVDWQKGAVLITWCL